MTGLEILALVEASLAVAEQGMALVERHRAGLTPEARELLHERTRKMVARARALADGQPPPD